MGQSAILLMSVHKFRSLGLHGSNFGHLPNSKHDSIKISFKHCVRNNDVTLNVFVWFLRLCCLAVGYSHAAIAVVIPMPVVRFTSGTTAAAALQSALVAGDGLITGVGSAVFFVMIAGSF